MRIAAALIVFLVLIMFPAPTMAAKKRVRLPRPAVKTIPYSSARLSRPNHSVVVTLLNMSGVAKDTYMLSYMANGVPQGAMGTVSTHGDGSETRDLYFGTCSKGVCTPHYNIKNAILTITTELTNGSTFIKRYRLKI